MREKASTRSNDAIAAVEALQRIVETSSRFPAASVLALLLVGGFILVIAALVL